MLIGFDDYDPDKAMHLLGSWLYDWKHIMHLKKDLLKCRAEKCCTSTYESFLIYELLECDLLDFVKFCHRLRAKH